MQQTENIADNDVRYREATLFFSMLKERFLFEMQLKRERTKNPWIDKWESEESFRLLRLDRGYRHEYLYLEAMRPVALDIYTKAIEYKSVLSREVQKRVELESFGIVQILCEMHITGIPGKDFFFNKSLPI